MQNTVREWRGVVAEIRWHSYTAAGIRGYVLRRAPSGDLTVRATVLLSDAFKLAQRPLTLIIPARIGKAPHQRDVEYVYPIDSYTLRDSALEATLGPRIRGIHAAMPFHRSDPRSPIVIVGR